MMRGVKSLALLSWIFLSACSPIATPPLSRYLLGRLNLNTALNTKAVPKTRYTLLVSTPVASPGYRTSAMIYMRSPYELKAYANNRWVASPAQMLGPLFVQTLLYSSYFYAIVSPPFAGVTDYRLDIQVLKLQQEFMQPESQVRLAVQASLISSDRQRVLASRRFEVLLPAPGNNPYSGVLAANKAAERISSEVALFAVKQVGLARASPLK